jgi:acetylornithine deacetylase
VTLAADAPWIADALARLVRVDSVNPAFSGGRTNEAAIADLVGGLLRGLGMRVARYEPEPGRASVVGRLAGAGGGRSVMLYAHHDTVGVEGMTEPFAAAVREGRLYGRGAYDMKGSLAACLGAVKALRDAGTRLAGDLLVAAVADEEAASLGMEDLLRHVRPDAAIVTEPTELALCLAHKGFAWIDVTVLGRAAHGSRFDLGVDANLRLGMVLAALGRLEREVRSRAPHPLVGPPSLHVGVLHGGTGASTYAQRAVATIERRLLPAERPEDALSEVRAILDELCAADPEFRADASLRLARPGYELPPDAAVARAVRAAAVEVLGAAPAEVGVTYWMDAALLAENRLAEILARAAAAVCGVA